jgi:hypothetical protein
VAGTFVVIEYATHRSGVNEIGSSNPVVIVSAFSLLIRIVTALLARLPKRSAPGPTNQLLLVLRYDLLRDKPLTHIGG